MNQNSSKNNKRKRAVNFTELEVRMLVEVVLKYIHTVENKTIDAVTWKQKQNVWEDIAREFNPLTGQVNRTARELKLKYECIKKKIKKKQSHNKFEHFKTGGGVPNIETFTDYEDKILNHIVLSVDGLLPEDDCDGEYLDETQKKVVVRQNQSKMKTTEVIPSSIPNLGVPVIPDFSSNVDDENMMIFHIDNIDSESSSLIKATELNMTTKNEVECNDNVEGHCQERKSQSIKKNKSNNNLEDSLETAVNHHDNNNKNEVPLSYSSESSRLVLNDMNKGNKELSYQTSSPTWSQWNSTQLKTAKHKALVKKTKLKPVQKDTLNTKIATVTDSRQELLVLQISIAKNEEERKAAEHAEKLNNLKLEGKGIKDKNELFTKETQLIDLKITNEKLKKQLLQLQLQNVLKE